MDIVGLKMWATYCPLSSCVHYTPTSPSSPKCRRDQLTMRVTRRATRGTIGNQVFFQVDPYDVIAALLETISYGILLVLFTLSTMLLVQRSRVMLREKTREAGKLRSLMVYLVTSVLMFLFITAKWTFWWAEVLPIPGEPDREVHIPRLKRTTYRFKEACLQSTVLLGDILTVYRLWTLSKRSKMMIAFPVVGVFGYLVSAMALTGFANDTTDTPMPIINGRLILSCWDIVAISCTVGITVYVTGMITWIIIRERLRVGAIALTRGLKHVLAVIIESAAIYTTWCILFLITGLGFQSQIALAFLDCIPVIYGISVTLINVRVGLGWALIPGVVNETVSGDGSDESSGRRGVLISSVVYTIDSGESISCVSRHSRRDSEMSEFEFRVGRRSLMDVEVASDGEERKRVSMVSSIAPPEKAFVVSR